MAKRTILVTTATGTVGSELARELVARGHAVRAATRSPQKHPRVEGVTPVRFAYDDAATHAPALEGADGVFVISPTGAVEPHALLGPFLDRAARDGRKIVTMTADGVQHDDAMPLRRLELAVERSGVPFVHLRPNWFMQNFETFWGPPIKQHGVIPLPAADAKTAFVDARDIAAAAAAAFDTDAFDGGGYALSGPEALTYGEAAALLGRAAGRRIEYAPIDDETFRQTLLAAGMAPAYAAVLVWLFGAVRAGYAATVGPDLPKILGRAPRTLEAYANERAAAFRAG